MGVITFTHDLKAEGTEIFEQQYEPELQLENKDKQEILDYGLAVWMFVDGNLAGETYGICVNDDLEQIEDTEFRDPTEIYCYSTTILPEFQGKGYGKILKAYWLGFVRGYKGTGVTIIGHATSAAMVKVNKQFGVTFLTAHPKWYGTERVARFYELRP